MILPSHCAITLQAKRFSADEHNALIRVCGNAGNVIETREHNGEFKE
jgi:hypothetical protein